MKHRRYRVMPYVSIILLLTALMCLLNFQTFVFSLNKDYYEAVSAKVVSQSFDGLTALIPKIEVQYSYENHEYDESFLFYNTWIFLNSSIGGSIEVEVNKLSPQNFIYVHDFWDSYVNIVLVVINSVCTVIIANNIRRFIPQYVRERFTRRARKEARRRIRVARLNEEGVEGAKKE